MKDIKQFILEKKGYWNSKYIKIEALLDFGVKALKTSKEYASEIQDELSHYKNPDDLNEAWENQKLTHYCNWENALCELLFNDDKYSGKEGDIAEEVWAHAYDVLEDLYNMTN